MAIKTQAEIDELKRLQATQKTRLFSPEQARTFLKQQAAMQSRAAAPLPAAPSFASLNAQADREAQRAAAESNANMIMGKSGLPQGFALGPQGQLIPERQLRAGLQSAVTPMAPVGPDMTNQQATATQARVGTNVATPTGVFSRPMNIDTNFSASAPMDAKTGRPIAETTEQRADREAARFAQTRANTQMMQQARYQTTTREAGNARVRQQEQDQINREQGLMSAQQQAANNQAKVDVATQQGQNAAMATAKGRVDAVLAGQTGLAGAGQPARLEEDEDGVLRNTITGKAATPNEVKQYQGKQKEDASVETARGLAPVKEHWGITKALFPTEPNMYGFNPKTGEYKEFGNKDQLANNKQFIPLSPEQQKAFNEGNKGLASAAGPAQAQGGQAQAAGMQTFGSVQEAEAAGLPKGTRVKIGGRTAIIE